MIATHTIAKPRVLDHVIASIEIHAKITIRLGRHCEIRVPLLPAFEKSRNNESSPMIIGMPLVTNMMA